MCVDVGGHSRCAPTRSLKSDLRGARTVTAPFASPKQVEYSSSPFQDRKLRRQQEEGDTAQHQVVTLRLRASRKTFLTPHRPHTPSREPVGSHRMLMSPFPAAGRANEKSKQRTDPRGSLWSPAHQLVNVCQHQLGFWIVEVEVKCRRRRRRGSPSGERERARNGAAALRSHRYSSGKEKKYSADAFACQPSSVFVDTFGSGSQSPLGGRLLGDRDVERQSSHVEVTMDMMIMCVTFHSVCI